MFYSVLTTNPGLIILLQGSCFKCHTKALPSPGAVRNRLRDACGAFAESVRWEEGSGWELCIRDTQELGQAAGKLSRTSVP